MTSEQYQALLHELARVAGLSDTSSLLEHGRVTIGESSALLEHNPGYDADLLQVRLLLGRFPTEHADVVSKALLEANYISGYGGECVFSLLPGSDDVVITMRMKLHPSLSPQELWQELSDIARHGSKMWEEVVAKIPQAPGASARSFGAASLIPI